MHPPILLAPSYAQAQSLLPRSPKPTISNRPINTVTNMLQDTQKACTTGETLNPTSRYRYTFHATHIRVASRNPIKPRVPFPHPCCPTRKRKQHAKRNKERNNPPDRTHYLRAEGAQTHLQVMHLQVMHLQVMHFTSQFDKPSQIYHQPANKGTATKSPSHPPALESNGTSPLPLPQSFLKKGRRKIKGRKTTTSPGHHSVSPPKIQYHQTTHTPATYTKNTLTAPLPP